MGLPFGKVVQISGPSDTGKSSLAITAIKAAQEQGVAVILAETELKTTAKDLEAWGVDVDNVMLIQSSITEEIFDGVFKMWDSFYSEYPNEKVLFVLDSFGNSISRRDSELDLMTENSQPGGKSKTNRLGINKLIAKMNTDRAAVLICNYSYANIGTVGRTNAGGDSINFFSSLTIQSSRVGWVEAQVKGIKVRKGAKCKWTVYKNHYKNPTDTEGNPILLPKSIEIEITAEGIKRVK